MSQFSVMEFSGGDSPEYVSHANKFSKEDTVANFNFEYGHLIDNGTFRSATLADIAERRVRYFIQKPDYCGLDIDSGGCYSFCDNEARGSFPVWVIQLDSLRASSQSLVASS